MSDKKNNRQKQDQAYEVPPFQRTITIPEGASEKDFPELPGREIIREPVAIQKEPLIHGTRLSYSLTLSELTEWSKRVTHRFQGFQNMIDAMNLSIRPYQLLPREVEDFNHRLRGDFEQLRDEVMQALGNVQQSLDSLLQGKAKPNEQTLDMVMQTLQQLEGRVRRLESRGRS